MQIDLTTLWGIIPTALAIYYFIQTYRRNTKEEGKVDTAQDLQITKLWSQIDLLKADIKHLQDRVTENKNEALQEFKKIDKKLDEITALIINMKR